MALADHCVVMNGGRIEDEGAPERVYARPATRFAATFMGESTLIPGKVEAIAGDHVTVSTAFGHLEVAGHAAIGAAVQLAVRPERLRVTGAPGDVSFGAVAVRDVVFQGAFRRVLATAPARPSIDFIIRIPPETAVAPGDRLAVSCAPEALILLAE